MIPGAEALYQRIAECLQQCIAADWFTAKIEATFNPGSSTYLGEYTRKADGVARSIEGGAIDLGRAIRALRAKFEEAGKPLWGYFRLEMDASGKFNVHFGYENCDADGNAILLSEEEEVRRHRERHKRLTE